jgi:GT2 family glycosyltransferase
MRVSVLIVGYRNLRHLDACIGGAIRSLEGVDGEILFIDCSNDGSEAFVRGRFPGVRVLPFAGNLGFGRGNNHLAREARGEYLLLLNPDTIPRADELARLRDLRQFNDTIREEEVTSLEAHQQALKDALATPQLRLDALRLFWCRPASAKE